MHVVIDARESGTSTGRYVDKMIEYLHPLMETHDVTVLTKPHRMKFCQAIAPGFTVVEADVKEFTFNEQLGFMMQIRRLKPDLVHFTMVHQPILYPGKVVTTMQDLTTARFRNPAKNWLVFTFKQQIYKLVNLIAAKKSRRLIAPSGFVKQDVINYCHVKPAKITVTHEAADKITEAAEPVKSVGKKQFLLYVGRPLPHKNLRRLVDAFALLKIDHPDLHLVFAGKFDHGFEQLQRYAVEAPGVIFTDFVTEGQLRWLYEHAAVYVFPSLSEGFGLPGLEAMQYGLPVAASDATSLPEVYQDAAYYFDPYDTEDMVNRISHILDDKSLADRLSKKGHALVKTYSWKRMAEQTLEVYRKALND